MADSFDPQRILVKRPPRWRWFKRAGIFLLILLVGWACRHVYWHHKVSRELQEALAELDRTDPGWRLQDIEAARAAVPEKQNSAVVVAESFRWLPQSWPGREFG